MAQTKTLQETGAIVRDNVQADVGMEEGMEEAD